MVEVDFKLNYRENFIGDTIWQKIKSAFVDKYEYEKRAMGDFSYIPIFNWKLCGIRVYLSSIRDKVERSGAIIKIDDNEMKSYDELGEYGKFMAYEITLTQVIAHEYLHYIFTDLNLDLTGKRQHYAINKLGIWIGGDVDV